MAEGCPLVSTCARILAHQFALHMLIELLYRRVSKSKPGTL